MTCCRLPATPFAVISAFLGPGVGGCRSIGHMTVNACGVRIVVTGVALAVLAGCGSATNSSSASDTPTSATKPSETSTTTAATTTPAQAAGPACDEVWDEGADLPGSYSGCADGAEAVAAEQVDCSSGQFIVVYDDHYWAVRGHIIGYAPDTLAQSAAYRRVLYSCRA